MLIGELLQTFFQTLASPLAGFRQHFTFDVGQTRQGFWIWFHQMTRLPWVAFLPVEEPLPHQLKDSVKMHPFDPHHCFCASGIAFLLSASEPLMPIPLLNENGLLPMGIHICILEEIRQRFGRFQGSDRRPHLNECACNPI